MKTSVKKSVAIAFALFSSALFSAQLSAQAQITLKGQLTQGSMILGKVAQGSEVFLDGKAIRVTASGDFVFGFGRDETLAHELKVVKPDGSIEVKPLKLKKRQYKIEDIKGIDKKYVSPPEKVLARIRDDNRQVGVARAVMSDRLDFLDTVLLPVKGRISGVFGSQRVLNGVPKRPHFGLDIAAPTGTKVASPLSGKVVLADDDMYYTGGTLILEHGYGITSTFIHLNKVLVKVGDEIKQGDIIAEVGATGRVTGPHLDWRMNWGKVRLDPQLLLESGP